MAETQIPADFHLLPKRVDDIEEDVAGLSTDVRGLRDEMGALRVEMHSLGETLVTEGKENRALAREFSGQLLKLHTEGMGASRAERRTMMGALLVVVLLVVVAGLALWDKGMSANLSSDGVEIRSDRLTG